MKIKTKKNTIITDEDINFVFFLLTRKKRKTVIKNLFSTGQ